MTALLTDPLTWFTLFALYLLVRAYWHDNFDGWV